MGEDWTMNVVRALLAPMLIWALLGTEAECATAVRDFSGDAMQRHHSRMMDSPLRFRPGIFGTTLWPYPDYYVPSTRTIVNIQILMPAAAQPEPPQPPPPAAAKFWIARCGAVVEIEMGATTSLMEEEAKPCPE